MVKFINHFPCHQKSRAKNVFFTKIPPPMKLSGAKIRHNSIVFRDKHYSIGVGSKVDGLAEVNVFAENRRFFYLTNFLFKILLAK